MDKGVGVALTFSLVFGIAFTAAGAAEIRDVYRLRRHGLRAEGTVVDSKSVRRNGEKGPYRAWHHRVAFTDHLGQRREFYTEDAGHSAPLGQSLGVIYLPYGPDRAREASRLKTKLGISVSLLFGLLCSALAVAIALGVLPV